MSIKNINLSANARVWYTQPHGGGKKKRCRRPAMSTPGGTPWFIPNSLRQRFQLGWHNNMPATSWLSCCIAFTFHEIWRWLKNVFSGTCYKGAIPSGNILPYHFFVFAVGFPFFAFHSSAMRRRTFLSPSSYSTSHSDLTCSHLFIAMVNASITVERRLRLLSLCNSSRTIRSSSKRPSSAWRRFRLKVPCPCTISVTS